eukprot:68931_1
MVIPVHPEERLTANEYVYPILVTSSLSSIIMLPIMFSITYSYMKNKKELADKSAMFGTGVLYFLITILFYINYALRLLNYLTYGKHSLDNILINTTALLYGGHFTLLIILLFGRIYYVFNDTQYKLAPITLIIFFFLLIFGFIDVAFFGYAVLFNNSKIKNISYIAGTFAIDFTIIWIAILYVYKLFQVIKTTSKYSIRRRHSISSVTSFSKTRSFSRKSNIESSAAKNPNDALLVTITKYTVLSTISILISMFFWMIPYIGLTVNWFVYVMLYNAFMWLDITSNVMAFTMGYKFYNNFYIKLCQCPDNICKLCFECLVFYAIRDKKIARQSKINNNDTPRCDTSKVELSPSPIANIGQIKSLEITSQTNHSDEHIVVINDINDDVTCESNEIKESDINSFNCNQIVNSIHEHQNSTQL